MSIISKEVEVTLDAKGIIRYEKLGYDIPKYFCKIHKKFKVKRGTKIKVKVEDLSKNSSNKIKVKCDNCGKEYYIAYYNYNKYLHEGKNYCKRCGKIILNGRENNYLWNNNKSDEERLNDRKFSGYSEFVKMVLARDNYTCQCCGTNNNNMRVHHLDGYNWCKEKRTDVTNGITLCKTCHNNFHMKYGKGNNTKQQFEEWIGHTLGELDKYDGELPTARKIYCIEENKIYDSIIELQLRLKLNKKQNIYAVCNHYIVKQNNGFYICKTIKGKHLFWLTEWEKIEHDIKNGLYTIDNYLDNIKKYKIYEYNKTK